MPPKKDKMPPRPKYKVQEVEFAGKARLVVCRRREAAPFPLLALCNVLLLRNPRSIVIDTAKGNDGTRTVSLDKLKDYVLALLSAKLGDDIKAGTKVVADRAKVMEDYRAELVELQRRRMVLPNPSGTGVFDGNCPAEKSVFCALNVPWRHALLPGPKDEDLCRLTAQNESYVDLCKEYESYQKGLASEVPYDESMHDRMLAFERVLVDGAEFTKFGLDRLCQDTSDKELFIFYLNRDFHVVYKKEGELYLLAADEEMLSTYPGLVWIGLDEKFNHENPAETKRKFTSTFNPLNEKWFSDMNQLLEELEAEPEREIETSGPQKVEPTICHPTKEGKEVQGSGEGAEGKASEVEQVAEAKPIEITVPRRFLRFMNRFYQYKSQEFCSPSHIGRLCAKGYLVFIFKVHESGYSWNGEYTEDNMFVEFERVDGLCIGGTNFFIRQPTYQGFNKDKGKEDLRTFMKFLFPHYLPAKGSQLPWYFARFETDIEEMPDLEDPPLKWEIFILYMTNHFFSKAPLVRLTLVSNVYRVCDSEIVHVDRTQRKPRFKLLDEEMMRFKADIGDWLEDLSHPLKKSYERSRIETHYDHNRWTCWDAIELGRHCEQHGMDHTKDNGVQEMLHPEVIDLMLEQDLRGLLADAIKMIIQKTQFIGRLGAIWEQFCENEPHDDRTRIPYLSGEIQVPVAVEAEEQPALRISKYQSREEEVNQEFGY